MDLSKLDPVVIDVGDAKPIRVPARRIPHSQLKYSKQEIEFLLKIGIIEPSTSPWSGPNVFAGQLSRSECFWAPVFFFQSENERYASIFSNLHDLTAKGVPFVRSDSREESFCALSKALITPIFPESFRSCKVRRNQ